jgi:hypothetical protein
MHSIRIIQTPVGRALYSVTSPGLTLNADIASAAGFLLRSQSGLIVWTERLKSTCLIVHGESIARSVERDGGLHLLVLTKDARGEMVERYAIPAVDVMAVAPFDDAALQCRELLVRQCETRLLH